MTKAFSSHDKDNKKKKKNVSIDEGYNEVFEIERICPLEKAKNWWSKTDLKKIRNDFKNEVMMDGVRNLVKARIEQEEDDIEIIEERLEEMMANDPGSIAMFLQSEPKPMKLKSKKITKSKDKPSQSESDTDSDSESDSDSDSDSDDSSSSSSSSSSSEDDNWDILDRLRQKGEKEVELNSEHQVCELLGVCLCSEEKEVQTLSTIKKQLSSSEGKGRKINTTPKDTTTSITAVIERGSNPSISTGTATATADIYSGNNNDDSISSSSSDDDHSSSSSSSSSCSSSSDDESISSNDKETVQCKAIEVPINLDVRPSNNTNPTEHKKDKPRRRRSSSIESESESKSIIENREAGSNIQTSEKTRQNDLPSTTKIPENNHYKSTSDDDFVTMIPENNHYESTDDDDDPVTLKNNTNDDKNKTDDIRPVKRRSKIGKQESDVAKFNNNRKSLGGRFRQGALAVVVTERLEKIVKRAPPSPPPTNKLSLSSRLIEMYLPSDEEKEDDDKNSDDDDSSDDDSCCDENSECPVCLGLVKSSQHRKIILLRRMLCKRCLDTHYIQSGVKHEKSHGTSAIPNKSSRCSSSIPKATKHSYDNKLDLNVKKDIQMISPLKDNRYPRENSKGKEQRSLEGMKTNYESKELPLQRTDKSIGTKRSTSRRKESTTKQAKDTELIASAEEKSTESKSRISIRASKTDEALPSTFRSITENEIKR
jgi:hypothetical protein